MDLMTMPLASPGEAGLADPSAAPLVGGRGLFLAYPYGGIGNLSRHRRWVRTPPAFAVIGEKDLVTNPRDAAWLCDKVAGYGCELEVWRVPGAHAFDEGDTELSFYRYNPALAAQTVERFGRFLHQRLAVTLGAA
jgi:hypothetical protein